MSTFDAESPEADFALYHKAEHCGRWAACAHTEAGPALCKRS